MSLLELARRRVVETRVERVLGAVTVAATDAGRSQPLSASGPAAAGSLPLEGRSDDLARWAARLLGAEFFRCIHDPATPEEEREALREEVYCRADGIIRESGG